MLGVSPSTLRSWERRYGFPRPLRSPGGHRLYSLTEIEAMRLTLAETHNASSAVTLAQERGEGLSSSSRLADAFAAFDEQAANRLLEESLALRSYERTVEDLLLEAVSVHGSSEGASAEYEFAWRHATGWLSALKRLAPPAQRTEGVLIIDAAGRLELDSLHAQALDLILRRAGLRTLCLSPAIEPARLGRALRALRPAALVLTGQRTTLDVIGRVVYAVRGVAQQVVVFDYRNAVPDTGASTVCRLGDKPVGARDLLVARLEAAAAQSRPGSPAAALRLDRR
jgi:DNA-binding transcriptional MerR regulator